MLGVSWYIPSESLEHPVTLKFEFIEFEVSVNVVVCTLSLLCGSGLLEWLSHLAGP